jgi:hypothetical protein
MRRLTLVRSTAVAATAIAALTGCGAQVDGGAGPSSARAPTPTVTRTTPVLPPSSTPSEPLGTPSGPTLELDGVAAPGVEPGCVVFTTGGRHYLLLGAKGTVPTEVPIRVRGIVLTGVLSYCQQGTPLKVLEINRR